MDHEYNDTLVIRQPHKHEYNDTLVIRQPHKPDLDNYNLQINNLHCL